MCVHTMFTQGWEVFAIHYNLIGIGGFSLSELSQKDKDK